MRTGVFLDLNGTLAAPVKVDRLAELVEIAGAGEAITRLSAAEFVCPVVTVQSRIEKGIFTEEEFRNWFESFRESFEERGAFLLGPYLCPHRFEAECECKKPNPRLYVEAANEHGIDLLRSYVIGDTTADMEAASRFGGIGVLVKTGYGEADAGDARKYCSFVGNDLGKCVDWILARAG